MPMSAESEQARILLVDDNELVRSTLGPVLEFNEFVVTTASNVGEALHLIDTQPYDVLLCDLHMPGAGDGFTVVSAMRHTNPEAITLVFTGYPALKEAMNAILLQADEILVKPLSIQSHSRETGKTRGTKGHKHGTSGIHIGTRHVGHDF